jgi:hypothetical protein
VKAAEAAGADAEGMAATAGVGAADAVDMVAAEAVVVVEDEGVAAGTGGTAKIFARIKQFSTGADRPLTSKGRAPAKTKADPSSLRSSG